MKTVYKMITIVVLLCFGFNNVSYASEINSFKLAASLATDSNINSARSKRVQNDIAERAEPGAIGNGVPLIELLYGKLPPRVKLTEQAYQDISQKLPMVGNGRPFERTFIRFQTFIIP